LFQSGAHGRELQLQVAAELAAESPEDHGGNDDRADP
jgi:hypothetical protein